MIWIIKGKKDIQSQLILCEKDLSCPLNKLNAFANLWW